MTRAPGYVLHVEDDELDVQQVRRLVAAAKVAPAEERVELLRRAESRWRGPPLAGVQVRRVRADRDRADGGAPSGGDSRTGSTAELELDRHADAVVELEGLVARAPAARASARAADDRALPQRPPGRGARRLPGRTTRTRRRARAGARAVRCSSCTRRSCARSARSTSRDAPPAQSRPLRGRRRRAARGSARAQCSAQTTGELARRLAERFDTPPDEARHARRACAIRRADARSRAALRRAARSGRTSTRDRRRCIDSSPPCRRSCASEALPHQLLVTTSYDLLLEQALLDAGEEFDVVSYLASGPNRGKFCHVPPDGDGAGDRGSEPVRDRARLERRTVDAEAARRDRPAPERAWESFVVTEDDYIDYLPSLDLAAAVPVALAAQLRRSHFLFLGYGMRDWNLRVVLNRLWGGPTVNYRSWAVAATAAPAERAFWRARDIELQERRPRGVRRAPLATRHRRRIENGIERRGVTPFKGLASFDGHRARCAPLLRTRA